MNMVDYNHFCHRSFMRIMLNLAECVTISLIIIGGVYYWFKVEMFNLYSVGIPIFKIYYCCLSHY